MSRIATSRLTVLPLDSARPTILRWRVRSIFGNTTLTAPDRGEDPELQVITEYLLARACAPFTLAPLPGRSGEYQLAITYPDHGTRTTRIP